MAFDLTEFVRIRPFVYHLTSESNLASIRRNRQLHPARELLHRAGEPQRARQHRPASVSIEVDGEILHIRDQAPLKRGNLALSSDWMFEDVVELLNSRVFFWPGTARGPVPSGERHFLRYADEAVAILRVPTGELFAANPNVVPEFCKWNSGAPRWSRGIQPVRGPSTFGHAAELSYRGREVVELTFTRPVVLPSGTVVGPSASGPWASL